MTYITNFYVEPNIGLIAEYYNCYPTAGLLPTIEDNIATSLIPFYSILIQPLEALIANPNAPVIAAPYNSNVAGFCTASDVEELAFTMLNVYGVIGVISVFIPLINLVIVITVIIGISGLLGGDTSLAGLSKLI